MDELASGKSAEAGKFDDLKSSNYSFQESQLMKNRRGSTSMSTSILNELLKIQQVLQLKEHKR